MPYTGIKENCLYIDDLDQAVEFYQGVLEMPVISKSDGRHVFFRCGSSVLLCFLPEITRQETTLPPHFAYGKQHLAFEVMAEDYNDTVSRLEQKGVPITHVQDWGNGHNSIYFEDPFGHVLEIVPKGIWE
ncbi:VOC family protein [Cyclobacterium lianum]|uniref:VOC family protein n=1 Tax=Cyclobacterium lianum TaxID=388280 RepID=UPI0009336778|nr:VOC family protein [Cyclobacterium lianum]